MLDLDTMLTELREHLGVDELDLSDTPAILLINRSFAEVTNKLKIRAKEVTATFPTEVGVRLYAVPTAFEALRSLSITTLDTLQHYILKRMTPNHYEDVYNETVDEQAIPTHYVREADCIRLWPTPDDVYTITIKYYKFLNDLLDPTITSLGVQKNLEEIVLMGAIYRGFVRLGFWDRANAARSHQSSLIDGAKMVEEIEETDNRYSGFEVILPEYP